MAREHSNCTVFLASSPHRVHMLFNLYIVLLVAFKRHHFPSIPVVLRYCVLFFLPFFCFSSPVPCYVFFAFPPAKHSVNEAYEREG